MKKCRKNTLKSSSGITLIALVVTIIVLLILASISIAMLTGENGLINQAKNAKEITGIAQIKERAELAKQSLNIEAWANRNNGIIKRNELVSAINKEFEGSTISGSVVTTADKQYDIIVDNELNITVVKHQETKRGVPFTYIANETGSRAVALDIYPVVEGSEDAPTFDEWQQEQIEGKTEEELEQMFVEGNNYWNEVNGWGEPTYNNIEELMTYWKENYGGDYTDVNGMVEHYGYENLTSMIISWWYANPKEYEEYCETYDIKITCNGETQTINLLSQTYAEFAITTNGEYIISVIDADNNKTEEKVEITGCKIETYSNIYTENTTTTIDGYNVTIPAGFAVGTSENVGHITTGLVITDSVDSNGNSKGNEFVWIPVDKTNLTVGNTDKAIARISSGTDYQGVLYDFSVTTSTEKTYYGVSTKKNREPATISKYDHEELLFDDSIEGITTTSLQSEYNAIIASIQTYGGFYVARYEMGIENGMAISKLGITPTSSGSNETCTWYGLYSKGKTYTNDKNSVASNMIWGSQYDAMLNFALTGSDASKVTSSEYGNYSGGLLKSGLAETPDSINNIYDLAGNIAEFTLEAIGDTARVWRGGSYETIDQPATRDLWYPTINSYSIGTRLILYIR